MIDRLYAVAVSGLVSGPFAIYKSPHANGFTLVHLPSQAKIIDLEMQNCCKDAAERFAALDLNWWTCIPEEVFCPFAGTCGRGTLWSSGKYWYCQQEC